MAMPANRVRLETAPRPPEGFDVEHEGRLFQFTLLEGIDAYNAFVEQQRGPTAETALADFARALRLDDVPVEIVQQVVVLLSEQLPLIEEQSKKFLAAMEKVSGQPLPPAD